MSGTILVSLSVIRTFSLRFEYVFSRFLLDDTRVWYIKILDSDDTLNNQRWPSNDIQSCSSKHLFGDRRQNAMPLLPPCGSSNHTLWTVLVFFCSCRSFCVDVFYSLTGQGHMFTTFNENSISVFEKMPTLEGSPYGTYTGRAPEDCPRYLVVPSDTPLSDLRIVFGM